MGNRPPGIRFPGHDFMDSDDDEDGFYSEDEYDESYYQRQGPPGEIPITIRDSIVESIPESNTKKQIVNVLEISESVGDYCTGGKLSVDYTIPAIEVLQEDGKYRPLPLPIVYKEQANDLIKNCSKSPFGRGEATVYDDNVRKSWQLDPNNFKITNPKWNDLIEDLVNNKVKKELGIGQEKTIGFSLYKMLLYEQGGFFDFHRDTEKEEGMIATMIVQLPSSFTGGEIIVRHNEREEKFETCQEATYNPFYVSFYCDCSHKVEPVTSGYRLALIYNLKYSGSEKIQVFDKSSQLSQLLNVVQNWTDQPMYSKLCYILEHKYSIAGLNPTLLKGKDEAIYQLFTKLGSNVEISLAILEKHETSNGSCVRDLEDTSLVYRAMLTNNNNNETSKRFINLVEDEVFPDTRRRNMPETSRDIETTGNEGATIERLYNSACIIISPVELKQLAAHIMSRTYLKELFQRYNRDPTATNKRLLLAYASSKLCCSEDSECNHNAIAREDELLLQICITLSYLPLSLKFIDRSWSGDGLRSKSELEPVIKIMKHHGIGNVYFKTLFDKHIQSCLKDSYRYGGELAAIGTLVKEIEDPTWVETFVSKISPTMASSQYSSINADALVILLNLQEQFPSTSEKIGPFLTACYANDSIMKTFNAELIVRLNKVELCSNLFDSSFNYYFKADKIGEMATVIKHFGYEATNEMLSVSLLKSITRRLDSAIDFLPDLIAMNGKEEQLIASKFTEIVLKLSSTGSFQVNPAVKLLTALRKNEKSSEEVDFAKGIIANNTYCSTLPWMYDLVQQIIKTNGTECFWTGSGFRLLLEHCYKLLYNAANSNSDAILQLKIGTDQGGNDDGSKWKFTHITIACTCEHCNKVKNFLNSTDRVLAIREKLQTRKHVEKNLLNVVDLDKETIKAGSPQTLRLTKRLRSAALKKPLLTAIEQILQKFIQYATDSDQKPHSGGGSSSSTDESAVEPPTKKVKQEK